ncbi:MAG: aa3-type cytochrome c oxidase subunit IV [Allosphingosinicella sp.]
MTADETDQAVRSHQGTYHFFIGLMKYGAIISAATAILVILIIRN